MTETPEVPPTYVRFEMACRATCKLDGPHFPSTKKGSADQQGYIEANWRSYMPGMLEAYASWEAHQ